MNTLFDKVGPARSQPVYRALTKILHGDDNRDTGDSRLQQQLNDAYIRLPRRLIMQAVYRP